MNYTVFVIDDEQSIREAVSEGFSQKYTIHVFESAEEGISEISRLSPDLVLLDIGLPGMDGVEALARIKQINPEILVVMITAFEEVDMVISAMKHGAEDYIIKPLDMGRLTVTISNALETIRLKKEVKLLQEKYLKEKTPLFIRGGEAIQDVMDFVQKVAKSEDTPVLILGETGTGKELIAQAIHYRSPNFKGPFVTVNCAAVPRELIESELFGYEKGAFTGAREKGKTGMVEEAAEGTLFLDEVADLSPEAQAKMLRFLESGEFYRVGSTKKLHVTTRIVSATNKDLERMIEQGEFRRDLFFRLGVIQVKVPSLNERREEIPVLVKHFLAEFNRKFKKDFTGLTPEAEEMLKNHPFTGHVRELKNLVERAALIGEGPELIPGDFGIGSSPAGPHAGTAIPPFPELTEQGLDLEKFQADLETYYYSRAMEMADSNMVKAAKLLRLNYFVFRRRNEKLQNGTDAE